MQAFFLLSPHKSIVFAIIHSNTASTVDSAANDINTKKRLPHSLPRGILLKMFGRVINNSFGPLVTSTPYAEQAGKIISPDATATNVSSSATFTDSPRSDLSLPI